MILDNSNTISLISMHILTNINTQMIWSNLLCESPFSASHLTSLLWHWMQFSHHRSITKNYPFLQRSTVIKEKEGAQRGRKLWLPSHAHSNLHRRAGRMSATDPACAPCALSILMGFCVHKSKVLPLKSEWKGGRLHMPSSQKLLMALFACDSHPERVHESIR